MMLTVVAGNRVAKKILEEWLRGRVTEWSYAGFKAGLEDASPVMGGGLRWVVMGGSLRWVVMGGWHGGREPNLRRFGWWQLWIEWPMMKEEHQSG